MIVSIVGSNATIKHILPHDQSSHSNSNSRTNFGASHKKVSTSTRNKQDQSQDQDGYQEANDRTPDITVARKELGWEPKVSVRDGLELTINYFRTLISEDPSVLGRD